MHFLRKNHLHKRLRNIFLQENEFFSCICQKKVVTLQRDLQTN